MPKAEIMSERNHSTNPLKHSKPINILILKDKVFITERHLIVKLSLHGCHRKAKHPDFPWPMGECQSGGLQSVTRCNSHVICVHAHFTAGIFTIKSYPEIFP